MNRDAGTQTVFYRVRATPGARPLGRGAIVSIIVRNPLTNADGTPNALEVIIGDGAGQLYDLLPGANTPEIYTADLKDIYVRSLFNFAAPPAVTETDVVIIAHRYPEPVRVRK